MAKDKDDEEEQLLRRLQQRGYVVRKPPSAYKKRTFEVDEEVYREFRAIVDSPPKKRIKDCFNEALYDWVKRNRKS